MSKRKGKKIENDRLHASKDSLLIMVHGNRGCGYQISKTTFWYLPKWHHYDIQIVQQLRTRTLIFRWKGIWWKWIDLNLFVTTICTGLSIRNVMLIAKGNEWLLYHNACSNGYYDSPYSITEILFILLNLNIPETFARKLLFLICGKMRGILIFVYYVV